MLSCMVEQDENVTRLSLLTTGRIVTCTFRPMLSPEQYSELLEMVRFESLSEHRMGGRLAELARRWQVILTIHTE